MKWALVGSDDVCHGHHFVPVHGKEVLGNILESIGEKEGDLLPQKEGPVEECSQSPYPVGRPGIATMKGLEQEGRPQLTRIRGENRKEGAKTQDRTG